MPVVSWISNRFGCPSLPISQGFCLQKPSRPTATLHSCFCDFNEVIEVQMGRHFFVEPPNCYATFTYEGKEFRTDTHHGATNPFLGGKQYFPTFLAANSKTNILGSHVWLEKDLALINANQNSSKVNFFTSTIWTDLASFSTFLGSGQIANVRLVMRESPSNLTLPWCSARVEKRLDRLWVESAIQTHDC